MLDPAWSLPLTSMFRLHLGYQGTAKLVRRCHVLNSEFRFMSGVVFSLPKDFVLANRGFSLSFLLLENPSGIWVVCWKVVCYPC